MKICMIGKETTPIPPPPRERAGAPQRWIWEVSKRLSKHHDVVVYSPGNRSFYSIKNGVPIFYKKGKDLAITRPAIIPFSHKMLTYYISALPMLKHFNPDIIHFHSTAPHPILPAKMHFKAQPIVSSVHQCVGFRTLSIPFKRIEDQLIAHSFKQADAILPVSNYVKNYLKSSYGLKENTKFYVTYCGVDPDLFKYYEKLADYARKRHQLANDPTILFVGRIVPEKAPHILVEAYRIVRKRVPNAKLILVGPIQTRAGLSSYASNIMKKCSNGAKFLGPLPYEELVALYCVTDVFVNPTIIPEAFGMVNIEAMACEKPVIATRIGAIPEIVEDGKTGILFPPEEPKALADAISYLLESCSLAREMGVAGRSRVLKYFTWDNVARRTLQAYKELLDAFLMKLGESKVGMQK